MADSAIRSVRERRADATRSELSRVCRRLTAERGFTGFTVEEICAEVGVSRRTFFNYFNSKEDAIVGHNADHYDEAALQRFLASGGGGTSLVEDIVELGLSTFQEAGLTAREASGFVAAVEREPRLLEKLMKSGSERETMLVELVALREGTTTSDALPRMAVTLAMTVMRLGAEALLDSGSDASFDVLVMRSLDTARAAFSPISSERTP